MALQIAFLSDFYQKPLGKKFQQDCLRALQRFPAPAKDDTVMAFGYAEPYLQKFAADTRHCFNFIPAAMADTAKKSRQAEALPPDKKTEQNFAEATKTKIAAKTKQRISAFIDDGRKFPLQDAAIDTIFAIHALEFCSDAQAMLREFWRILTPNGRLILVVPNRLGLWIHAENTPFGHGEPYSRRRLGEFLSHNGFDFGEIYEFAHFLPNKNHRLTLLSQSYEQLAKHFFPYFGGVLMAEAKKRLYNPLLRPDIKPSRLSFPPIFTPQTTG